MIIIVYQILLSLCRKKNVSVCSSEVCVHLNSLTVFLSSAAGGRFSQLEGRAVQSPAVVNTHISGYYRSYKTSDQCGRESVNLYLLHV